MAKLLPYDDASGNHYDASYWRPVDLQLAVAGRRYSVTFRGWKDEQARREGKEPIPGAAQEFYGSGDQYDEYFSPEVIKGRKTDHLAQCYALADATEIGKDDSGEPVTFFAGAEDKFEEPVKDVAGAGAKADA